uniref:Uncharacterized protein n=1 Tax=viral metagenome TaxID=1070528 RepID=A0A6C0IRZ4_9ZZZZ
MELNININSQQIITFIFVVSIIALILFVLVSYLVIKILQKSIDDNNIFFYKYNKQSQELLDKYGDYNVKRIYLVRQPLAKMFTIGLNLFTFYYYNDLIQKCNEYYPYHTLLLVEIELSENNIYKKELKETKFLLVEKNNCINISENFFISKTQETLAISLNKTTTHCNIKKKKIKITLNQLLDKTRNRIGSKAFFNWNIYKNNCQEFTKELLVTLNKMDSNIKEFIYRDKIIQFYNPSEFTLHIINCLCAVYNILEKYVFDSELFN